MGTVGQKWRKQSRIVLNGELLLGAYTTVWGEKKAGDDDDDTVKNRIAWTDSNWQSYRREATVTGQ